MVRLRPHRDRSAARATRRPDADPAVAIRAAVAVIARRRDEVTRQAALALVNQAEVRRALELQGRELVSAGEQLDDAVALARRVADQARDEDGAQAAAPYERHVEGLESQRAVLAAAHGQLDALRSASSGQVGEARDLLQRSRAALDEALREQLRLLIAIERLHAAEAIAQARRRSSP